jgi:spermidine synthase
VVKPWEELDAVTTPDGTWLELRHNDGEYVIRANGHDLMTSRTHGSEDAMMARACPEPKADACILIGGLGMGYTLRAALDLLPPTGSVVVVELSPAVVSWNRGLLGALAGHPLDDPRVVLDVGDVANVIRRSEGCFDAILLDVDNGPRALTQGTNRWLYTLAGLVAARRALRPRGAFAVWSAGSEPSFAARLRVAGFEPETHIVRARAGGKGPKQMVFVGRSP